MRAFTTNTIKKLTGRSITIDGSISTCELIGIIMERFGMLVRGTIRGFRIKKGKVLFLGKHVSIKTPKKMRIGSGSTIHNGCSINALSLRGIRIGKNFSLGKNSVIDCTGVIKELGEGLTIGDNVGISPNFTLFVRGGVSIGDDTIIGPNVTMVAENHISTDKSIPIRKQGTSRKGIIVGKGCWIGAGVTILDGVCIGDGTIVAAGAVVNKNTEPYTIVGGVPARCIKIR